MIGNRNRGASSRVTDSNVTISAVVSGMGLRAFDPAHVKLLPALPIAEFVHRILIDELFVLRRR